MWRQWHVLPSSPWFRGRFVTLSHCLAAGSGQNGNRSSLDIAGCPVTGSSSSSSILCLWRCDSCGPVVCKPTPAGCWTTHEIQLAFPSHSQESWCPLKPFQRNPELHLKASVKLSAGDHNTALCHSPAIPPRGFSEDFIIMSAQIIASWTTLLTCS